MWRLTTLPIPTVLIFTNKPSNEWAGRPRESGNNADFFREAAEQREHMAGHWDI